MRLMPVCAMMILVTLAVVDQGNADLYKYKDSEGVTKYTDDLSNVPEEKRKEIESMPEADTPPSEAEVGSEDNGQTKESVPGEDGGKEAAAEQNAETARELADRHAELTEESETLQEERQELESSRPGDDASEKERMEYSRKVDDLNERIAEYDKNAEAFEKEREEFDKGSAQ